LRLRFSGVTDAELIGARVEVRDPSTDTLLGMRVIAANHSYKSGGALEAHVGLGTHARTAVTVTLPNGKRIAFADVKADQFLEANLTQRTLNKVATRETGR